MQGEAVQRQQDERFHPVPTSEASRPPTVLYVGRLSPEKRVDTLIRAATRVAEVLEASVVVAGRGAQGHELHRLAQTLGLARRVHFVGFVPDDALPALLRSATVFVMPSAHELQSIACLEAMASGLPVIAADAMALPELVEDGKNGFLFPPGDAIALTDRIVRVLGDPVAARHLARASRQTAEHHGIERTFTALEALYRECLQRAAVSGRWAKSAG